MAEQLADRGGQIAHIVDEPGPTGFAVSCSLERAEFAVFAITASRIPRGYAGVAKTDRIDAVKLANYCTRLPFLRSSRRGIAPVRRRSRAAENRGKFKQKIKGLLLTSGMQEPVRMQKWSMAPSEDLSALPIPPEHRTALASMVREYLFLLSEDKQLR